MGPEAPVCGRHRGEDTCKGEVTWWIRPTDWTSWPYCARHGVEAQVEYERIVQTYGVGSDSPPDWFDPTYAGEEW